MPRYAKRNYKRRTYKKRPFRARRGIRTSRRGSKIHYFTRTFMSEHSVLTTGFQNEAALSLSMAVALTDMPQPQEFQNLFDEYKIKGVSNKFCFNRNTAIASQYATTVAQQLPYLITVSDYNDTGVLTTLNDAMEYESFRSRILSSDKPINKYYHPQPGLAYRNRWLSTATDASVNHFGLKVAVDTAVVATGIEIGILRVYTKVYMAFRNVK